MLILLAAAFADTPTAPVPIVARMAALYDEICLQTFPLDPQVDALMARKGATPLTADEVKVTLRDDPGRGWRLNEGAQTYLVILELPPFHACSVRTNVSGGTIDFAPYRAVADAFKAGHTGFAREKPMDADMGDVHVHAEQEHRDLPGGGGESLMVVDQHIIDPVRRNKGETGVMLRFVHQIRMPK